MVSEFPSFNFITDGDEELILSLKKELKIILQSKIKEHTIYYYNLCNGTYLVSNEEYDYDDYEVSVEYDEDDNKFNCIFVLV